MDKTAVVTTTIRMPVFLEDVCKNAQLYKHTNLSFFIIADNKTPAAARALCKDISRKYGYPILYYSIEDQKKKLKDYPELLQLIPENSGIRKLIGNFLAYLEGYDSLIMLDDDNFVTNQDFFGYHDVVGRDVEMDLIQTPSGWYNTLETVVEERGLPIYPRSFPWSKRFLRETTTHEKVRQKVVVLNGLVLEDPDVDAISRLFWPVRVTAMKQEFTPQFGLHPGTWSSFNNQNTSISKELIPVFFTPAAGMRTSDIWTGYVICRLAEEMNHVVAFGYPLVRQFRNYHNPWVDLEDERISNRATDRFVDILRSVKLTKTEYMPLLDELLTGSLEKLSATKDIPRDEYNIMQGFFTEYKMWHHICANARDMCIC